MRFKPVPPAPDDLATLDDARGAIPLVPAPEDDCCARVGDAIGCERGVAREWLTFLRALGVVRVAERGFVRTDAAVERAVLAEQFRDRVHGASEVLDVLDAVADFQSEERGAEATSGLTSATVAERAADALTRWERDRHQDAMEAWTERVGRLLEWAVLFGLAKRVETRDGGADGTLRYRPASSD